MRVKVTTLVREIISSRVTIVWFSVDVCFFSAVKFINFYMTTKSAGSISTKVLTYEPFFILGVIGLGACTPYLGLFLYV